MSTEGPQLAPPVASGTRAVWSDVPPEVHAWVADALGSPVVSAHSQASGFSPGVAARLTCADGERAFVKAVSPDQNPESPRLHRNEARITAALPEHPSLPKHLASYDDGYWVAMLFEEIDGRPPVLPWRADELGRVLDTLFELADVVDPCPVPDPTDGSAELAEMLGLWRELAASPPDDLDPWLAAHLDSILATAGSPPPEGTCLVHLDLRADNLLITPTGGVVLVDWAHGCTGPPWLDAALLMLEVNAHGGHDVDAVLAAHPLTKAADPALVTQAVLAASGMFEHMWRKPPPPGLPTIREFQRAYARATATWLRHRLTPTWG